MGQGKLNRYVVGESVLVMFAKYYQNWSLLLQTRACQSWRVFIESPCICVFVMDEQTRWRRFTMTRSCRTGAVSCVNPRKMAALDSRWVYYHLWQYITFTGGRSWRVVAVLTLLTVFTVDHSRFWVSRSFIQNSCWTTLQVSHLQEWKTCVTNGR